MVNRAVGFASLLAVIGVSIVFGMLLGGRLNAPQVVLAAPQPTLQLAPAANGVAGRVDFADIVENSMPAVVSITSTHLGEESEEDANPHGDRRTPEQQFWRFFMGPDSQEQQRTPSQPRVGEGSGFIISADGYVLTNYHVVEDADRVEVGMRDGSRREAEVIGQDPSIDLALLKVDPEGEILPTLPLGDSEGLRVGEWVIAIGNPLEFEQTVTVGVVSAKKRRVPVGQTDGGVVHFLQTDAAINFGNSGGPLLDGSGNVVGINTAIRRANYAEGIGFALPINHARQVIEQLRDRGYVKRGYIGITMNQDGVDDVVAEYYGLPDRFGVVIDEVTDGGPAEKAGLRSGDVIREVDGDVVRDNMDLISKIASHQPGDSVALRVFREGKMLNLEATLVDREEELASLRGGGRGTRRAPVEEEQDAEATAMGITVKPLTQPMRERLELERGFEGVIVSEVEFGTEAAEKRISPTMIVTAVNNRGITSLEEFEQAMSDLPAGSPVRIALRAGTRSFAVFLRAP